MGISFDPLWHLLIDKKLKKKYLVGTVGLSSATVTKLAKNKNVEMSVINKLCAHFGVPVEQVCRYIPVETPDNQK